MRHERRVPTNTGRVYSCIRNTASATISQVSRTVSVSLVDERGTRRPAHTHRAAQHTVKGKL
eukprot:7035364-Prymnesium_polylepis.1